MAERNERGTLNHLIETSRDAERGFRYAANHVQTPSVKALFLDTAAQRERFASDLLPHAQRLGGSSDADGTTAAALHRGWMTIKDALTGHSESAVIVEAERGEAAALAAYAEALEATLPPATRELIERQLADIRRTRDLIHTLAKG